jgi:hypothetical protein
MSTAHIVFLQNTGSTPVPFQKISIAGTARYDYSETTTCAGMLPPRTACSVTTYFIPARTGTRSATLNVGLAVPGSPLSVPMQGTGTP